MSWLQEHPFAVDAHFRRSLVLGFSTPIASVRALLPPQLEPDTFDAVHGFLAAAVVDTSGLRPAGIPDFLGSAFMLTGYRVFVRFRTASGKRLRGLYILRSETNSLRMCMLGNIFTHYNYLRTPVCMDAEGHRLSVANGSRGLSILADTGPDAPLPAGSVFNSWQEARRFAGPLPFTFSVAPGSKDVVVVEGSREHWVPQPVRILHARVPYLEQLLPGGLTLANAFIVEDIAYHWKKGRRELWMPDAADSKD